MAVIPIAIFSALLTFGPFFVWEWINKMSRKSSSSSDGGNSVRSLNTQGAALSGGIFHSFFSSSQSVPEYHAKVWSHPLKNKNFKIYVYDLLKKFNTQVLRESWRCGHHMFAAEVAFHKYLLGSAQRTLDPTKASLFYIPVYTTCNTSFAGNGPDPWFGRKFNDRSYQSRIDNISILE